MVPGYGKKDHVEIQDSNFKKTAINNKIVYCDLTKEFVFLKRPWLPGSNLTGHKASCCIVHLVLQPLRPLVMI